MKVLTIFSAILLPLTAYSNMMAMNATVPFLGNHYGFWIHLTIMGFISLITFGIFRWRRWI